MRSWCLLPIPPLYNQPSEKNIWKWQNSATFTLVSDFCCFVLPFSFFFFFNLGNGEFPKIMCLNHLNFGCLEIAWYTLILHVLSSRTQTVTQGLFVWCQENIPHLCEQVLLELLWKKWKSNLVKCQSCWDSYLNSISSSHFSEEKVCLLNQKITFVDERMKGILPSSLTHPHADFGAWPHWSTVYGNTN